MRLLMFPNLVQSQRIATDDDVPQGHRVEPDSIGEPPREAAVKLQSTTPVLNSSACSQCERSGNQPYQGRRCGPGVARHPDKVPADHRLNRSPLPRAYADSS